MPLMSSMEDQQDLALGEDIAAIAATIDAATHTLLTRIRAFDAREAWHRQGAISCAHWLSWRIGVDLHTAREQVRVARALGSLPAIDEAFRKGVLSYAKVRALTRIAKPETDERLAEIGLHSTGAQLEVICRRARAVATAMALDEGVPPPERSVRQRLLDNGLVRIEATLHPDEAALVWKALEAGRERLREETRAHDGAAQGPEGSHDHPAPECAGPPHDYAQAQNAGPRTPDDVPAGPSSHPGANRLGAAPSAHAGAGTSAHAGANEPDGGTCGDGGATLADGGATLADGGARLSSAAPSAHGGGNRPDSATFTHPGARRLGVVVPDKAPSAAPALADALVLAAESFLANEARVRPAPERHQILVHLEQHALGPDGTLAASLDDGTPVPAETLRRLACDGCLTVVSHDETGQPVHVSQRSRTVSGRLRTALWARDRGCRFPGCTHRLYVDAHHIQHWAHGGETSLANTVLLCARHHTLIHEGGFGLKRADDGDLVFRDPTGVALPAMPVPAEPPEDAVGSLGAEQRAHGVVIDALTNLSLWDGFPPDYERIVEVAGGWA